MKKILSLGITTLAIALSASPLSAKESFSQAASDTLFVCTTERTSATMYAHTPGNAVLTPLMSWHKEYLLPEASSAEVCQQTATKLQQLSQEKTARYLTTEAQPEQNIVCMVARENGNCSLEDSELLFSTNADFSTDCVLYRLEPTECIAIGTKRGGILSTSESPYIPTWWPW